MTLPSHASAPSQRDPALDGLRGVAVLLVYFYHYGGGLRSQNPLARAVGYFSQAGWVGVEVFFVLSGFLITSLLVGDLGTNGALLRFYMRRALRILPLYLAAVLACGIVALACGAALPQLKPLGLYLGFLQNLPPFIPAALHTPPPLPLFHLWSLAVEEQFYLLWPLLLLTAKTPRRAFILCLTAFVLSFGYRLVAVAPHELAAVTVQNLAVVLPSRGGGLALGCALALSRVLYPGARLERPARVTAVLSLAVFVTAGLLAGGSLLRSRPAFLLALPAADIGAAALLALALLPGSLRRMLSSRFLVFMGHISYGFYVLHLLLEPIFDHIGTALTHATSGYPYQSVRLLTAFPVTLAASWLSYTLLERPFLRLKRLFPHRNAALFTGPAAEIAPVP